MSVFCFLFPRLAHADAPVISSPTLAAAPLATVLVSTPSPIVTMLHPLEGQRLPLQTQVFAYGQVSPGSTLTLNGLPVTVHPKGAYLTMAPLLPGDNTIHAAVRSPWGAETALDRHILVSSGYVISPLYPLTLQKNSITPDESLWLLPGDSLRVGFQGSTGGSAEFIINGAAPQHVPMLEVGAGSITARGIYQGTYLIQTGDRLVDGAIDVVLKKDKRLVRQRAPGRVTLGAGGVPRIGQILDEVVAVRTASEGGYDFFLYRGMKVRLTGRSQGFWRAQFSSLQSGWIKESAVSEMPAGTSPPGCYLTNFSVTHPGENTLVRVPLSDMLPWRAEQSLGSGQLKITLYGAIDRTNLIRYDPVDPLIRLIEWKQVGPDTVQLLIEPTFQTWWGYDVRYEGGSLVIEIRAPWKSRDIKGLPIAVDAGHGGSDTGAVGGLGTLEKDTNLAIAKSVKDALEKAGAKPFLTRDRDIDVPLIERGKIAWRAGARLFISIHGNSSGVEENPLWNNGFSVYFYHPQSMALARAVHAQYRRLLPIPDHGLYYDDLAVCRVTQMPSILTEQAYLIVPDQEQLLIDPKFHSMVGEAITNGVKQWLAGQ